jgi:hypothetical protein
VRQWRDLVAAGHQVTPASVIEVARVLAAVVRERAARPKAATRDPVSGA